MSLTDRHLKELTEGSGLPPEVIAERGYFSAESTAELRRLGFKEQQRRVPALVVPIRGVTGEIVSYQIKPDYPRISVRNNKPIKYETPAEGSLHLDVPPRCLGWLGDPETPLFITEGAKKADKGAAAGLCVMDLLGVSGWRGRNEHGGLTALAEWEQVALKSRKSCRDVYIVFDSDVMTKKEVYREMRRLKGFLESRGARVYVIYLPPLAGGKKCGLDDFLLQGKGLHDLLGLAESELRPMPRDEEERDEDPNEKLLRLYVPKPDGLYYLKETEKGRVTVHVTNFRARINARITVDDGEEQTSLLEVEAWRNGHHWTGVLTPKEWSEMAWPAEKLMTAAGCLPGNGNRERADFGFRIRSEPIAETTHYAHIGWRQIEGQWLYLHGGGAIGADGAVDGVQVIERLGLNRYHLPEPPDLDDEADLEQLREAIRASLRFLDVGQRDQTWPILAAVYTAPLATLLPTDFVLWVRGTTGARKSTAVAAALCHFGDFDRHTLPANFTSTSNAIEAISFAAKDALLVVDDYAPAPDRRTQAQQDQVVHRLVRGVGDSRGRQRATRTGGLQSDKYPRCLALATSELPCPGSQGSEARTLECVWDKERVDLAKLAHVTRQDSRLYSLAMAAYIQRLASQMGPDTVSTLREMWTAERAKMPGEHGRLPESASKLLVGVHKFLRFAADVGALSAVEALQLLNEAREKLALCASRTGAGQGRRRPTALFLDAIRALLNGKEGYIAHKKAGGKPSQPELWGWDYVNSDWVYRGGSAKLGWVDEKNGQVYLLPDNAFKAAKRWTEQSSEMPFPGTRDSLAEALATEKLLARTSRGAGHHYIAWVEGHNEPCWALAVELVRPAGEAPEGEDEDAGGDPLPPDPEDAP